MATQLCSTFEIVTDLAAGTGTTNLATNRSMRVVSILGTGVTTAVFTVSKVSAAGVAVQVGVCTVLNSAGGGTDSLVDQAGVMDALANCTLLATDTLRIVRSAANGTRCILTCMADVGHTVVES